MFHLNSQYTQMMSNQSMVGGLSQSVMLNQSTRGSLA